MKRSLRKMYEEMIYDSLTQGTWTRKAWETLSGDLDYTYRMYKSPCQFMNEYTVRFECNKDILSVDVHIYVDKSFGKSEEANLRFWRGSRIYRAMTDMEKTFHSPEKKEKENLLLGAYREFKQQKDLREIENMEETIAELSKIEQECKMLIATLEKRKGED